MGLSPISPLILLCCYCGLILLASLAGGWIPMRIRLTHTRLQVATSFVAGMMLGVAVLHLLPHAWADFDSSDPTVRWLLGGFLVMFFIQRFFHFHHHDVPDEAAETSSASDLAPDDHDHCEHVHDQTLAHKSARQLSWSGAALGLGLHSLIDGIALAASVAAEAHGENGKGLLGLGTFAVIILHKPFDSMAVSTLMAAGGRSRLARHWVNVVFALAIPVGIALFFLGANRFGNENHHFLGAALAFTAGTFLCIAASDLLPELQFHSHDRVKLSVALISGLLLSALIGALETGSHAHEHGSAARPEPHEHLSR
jgi:zinc and cadmium transporter